jgi:hypothetical protein
VAVLLFTSKKHGLHSGIIIDNLNKHVSVVEYDLCDLHITCVA